MDNVVSQSPTFPIARQQVRDILTKSKAFRELPSEERKALAQNMVKVANYIVGGDDGYNVPTAASLAGSSSTKGADLPGIKPEKPTQTASDKMKANAAQQGGKALTDLVKGVDFPKFVAGLIDGVFNAIVDSSIKQMEAYAELLKNVSKSVDQYMKDNVSENQARDYLSNRYPDFVELDLNGDKPKAKTKQGHDENNMPDFFNDLGLSMPMDSFDDDQVEEVLVPAARKRMAMDRQQLLATMVMMGINRLVVTNGFIKSKVVFKLDTKDKVSDSFTQTAVQRGGEHQYENKRPSWWSSLFNDRTYSGSSSYSNFKVDTVDETNSDSEVKLKAELMGEVNVNFKSDYFPMEKMTEIMGVQDLQERYAKKTEQANTATGGK
jgi:isopenicillin N synthase-like dioxygenase